MQAANVKLHAQMVMLHAVRVLAQQGPLSNRIHLLIRGSHQLTQPHALLISTSTELLQIVCEALLRGCKLCNAISVLATALGQLEHASVEAVCLILKSCQLQEQARQGQVGQRLALALWFSAADSGLWAGACIGCVIQLQKQASGHQEN